MQKKKVIQQTEDFEVIVSFPGRLSSQSVVIKRRGTRRKKLKPPPELC